MVRRRSNLLIPAEWLISPLFESRKELQTSPNVARPATSAIARTVGIFREVMAAIDIFHGQKHWSRGARDIF
jgi:hypothetical protein